MTGRQILRILNSMVDTDLDSEIKVYDRRTGVAFRIESLREVTPMETHDDGPEQEADVDDGVHFVIDTEE